MSSLRFFWMNNMIHEVMEGVVPPPNALNESNLSYHESSKMMDVGI